MQEKKNIEEEVGQVIFLRRPAIVSTVKHVIERQQAIEVYQRKELHMDISYIFTMLCAFTHNTNSFHT